MSKSYLQLTIFLLLLLLGFLQYRLWFEANGLQDMLQLKNHLRQQIAENKNLKMANETLLTQIKQLKDDNEEEEETRARNELGMIKKGETFYQIVR